MGGMIEKPYFLGKKEFSRLAWYVHYILALKTKPTLENQKMNATKMIMNRVELVNVLYNDIDSPSTLVGTDYAIGGDLLVEAMANHGIIDEFDPMGDEGEYIEVDCDGYVIDDYIYE